jgi:hypothetical protein
MCPCIAELCVQQGSEEGVRSFQAEIPLQTFADFGTLAVTNSKSA